jgi:uncharacterized protein YigE (DUF2233 family)
MIRHAILAAAVVWGGPVLASACEQVAHRAQTFTVCEVGPDQSIELFHKDAQDQILGSFGAVRETVANRGRSLRMAMNAGMYHADRRPVGLYVEQGRQTAGIVTSAGPGNFGLLPNGVFCVQDTGARIFESRVFADAPAACTYATQSGPMLVIDGALHPRFLANATSRNLRNGVGTSADGRRVVFAISDTPVTFHEFGTLFRDVLDLPNALYFDGSVSRLYDATTGRSDAGLPMGPIVGVIAD